MIKHQLAMLDLLEETRGNDLHLSAAIRRKRAELIIEAALVGPAEEDAAEEHRLAAEARDAEQAARVAAANQRVEIVTEIPRPS